MCFSNSSPTMNRVATAGRPCSANSDLTVDPLPVELPRQLHQLVPQVDHLLQMRAVHVQLVGRHDLLRAHRDLLRRDRITASADLKAHSQFARLRHPNPPNLAIQNSPYCPITIARQRQSGFFTFNDVLRLKVSGPEGESQTGPSQVWFSRLVHKLNHCRASCSQSASKTRTSTGRKGQPTIPNAFAILSRPAGRSDGCCGALGV